ncbi:unnamed protein product [Ophioblennius macclurei]
MPESCAAWGCKNRRTLRSKSQGITFHKFPKQKAARRQWEAALRRRGFSASSSTVLCSAHFRREDFDTTGQIVRVRAGVKPSVFCFTKRPQPRGTMTTRSRGTSNKDEETATVDSAPLSTPSAPPSAVFSPPLSKEAKLLSNDDHSYALPESFSDLKNRLSEALSRVDSLEREMRNAKDRERRAKNMLHYLLTYLRKKNLLNEELKEKFHFHSGKII